MSKQQEFVQAALGVGHQVIQVDDPVINVGLAHTASALLYREVAQVVRIRHVTEIALNGDIVVSTWLHLLIVDSPNQAAIGIEMEEPIGYVTGYTGKRTFNNFMKEIKQ